LNADDAEDKEDEETQHENVAEHWQRVEQQRHQDTHTFSNNTGQCLLTLYYTKTINATSSNNTGR